MDQDAVAATKVLMTADQWIGVFAILGPMALGFTTLFIQRRRQHRERLREMQAQVHSNLLQAVAELAAALMGHGSRSDAERSYALAKARFSVAGSDLALKKLAELDAVLSGNELSEPKTDKGKALTALIRQARTDVVGKTNLSDAVLFRATSLHE